MLTVITALAVALTVGVLWRRRIASAAENELALRLPVGPSGIIVGAEPIDLPRHGAPAVLLVHGGGDTPQALGGLADHLHERGFAVRAPLLPGHGRTLRAFASSTADAWLGAVRDEYHALATQHEWVGIVGLSMGGALTVQLVARMPAVPAVVLLSPYLSMPRSLTLVARLAPAWGTFVPYVRARGERSIHDPEAAAISRGYGIFSAVALRALSITVRRGRAALPQVRTPVLMIQSREDNRISPRNARAAFDMLGSQEKKLVWLEGTGHVITVDYGYERVFAMTADWLESHGGRTTDLED